MSLTQYLSSEVIAAMIGLASVLATGFATYFVTVRQQKTIREKEKQEREVEKAEAIDVAFDALTQANEKFRDEVRGDLAVARRQIAELQDAIKLKDREIEELQNAMKDMRQELSLKESIIADMRTEIIRRNLRVQELIALSEKSDEPTSQQ